MCFIMETHTPTAEQAQVADYAWLEVSAIDQMRADQQAAISQRAFDSHYAGGVDVAFSQAETELAPELDEQIEAYVDQRLGENADPAMRTVIVSHLKECAAYRMNDQMWANGELQNDEHQYNTSGSFKTDLLLDVLRETDATQDDPEADDESEASAAFDPFSPEAQETYGALTKARNEFAKLSVEGRQRSLKLGIGKSKKFNIALEKAHEEYQKAYNAVLDMHIAHYRDAGEVPETVYEQMMTHVIKEHKDFSAAEYEQLSQDKSLRGRVARTLSKRGGLIGLSAASGVASGLVARAISTGTKGLLIGMTGGAAAGAYFGARLARGPLLAKVKSGIALHKEFTKRHEVDHEAVKARIAEISGKTEDEVRTAVSHIGAIMMGRVETDRKTNFKREVLGAAVGAGAAALAFEFVPVVHDLWNGHGTPPSTHGGGTPPPPHGGTTPPPVDNYGYTPSVTVEHGHGYIKEIQDLAAQKGQHLSIAQATDAYHHILNNQGANFFTNDANLPHGGDNWISRPGAATWDHNHLASFHHWLQAQHDLEKVA